MDCGEEMAVFLDCKSKTHKAQIFESQLAVAGSGKIHKDFAVEVHAVDKRLQAECFKANGHKADSTLAQEGFEFAVRGMLDGKSLVLRGRDRKTSGRRHRGVEQERRQQPGHSSNTEHE